MEFDGYKADKSYALFRTKLRCMSHFVEMRRMLSSRTTFVWKIIFPLVWSGGFGLATLWLFLNTVDATGKPIPVWVKWQFLIMWILGTLFILWLVARLKRVFRDESSLYISNYQTEISVLLSNVASVRENRRVHVGGKHPIIIEFAAPTLFGRKIVFIPSGKTPLAWPWQKKPHPIAVELQNVLSS